MFEDNHHHNPWIFLSLSLTSRVRLTVTHEDSAFILDKGDNEELLIKDMATKEIVAKNVVYEEAIVHAPEQLFLGLYEYCKVGCKFCPCSARIEKIHYSLDSIYEDIDNSSHNSYTSIGITTSIPPSLSADEVADEMIFIVRKIERKLARKYQ